MSLVLQSSGGGQITLSEPATASNFTLSLPATTGTVITSGDAATVTPTMLSQSLTRATPIASTSGTSIDFTGIPSWADRVTVLLQGVSTNGTSDFLIQIGAGSVVTTGYLGAAGNVSGAGTAVTSYTAGFGIVNPSTGAATVLHGSVVITNITSNTWVASSVVGMSDSARVGHGGGSVSLSGALDRVRITTVGGTNTFDAGNINILYE